MRNFLALTESIAYIEANLTEPITREAIAGHCYVSLSLLEKLFRYALHLSIKDYLTRRRMTQAAGDILKSGLSVTEIAAKYQYNSPEVFLRAFRQVWQTTPSRFKKKWKFSGIFPKHDFAYTKGEDLEMARKKVDLSEAYDFFRQRRGTYVICFDIHGLMPINAFSSKAGDQAILTAAARLNDAAGEDMLVLRIGGDEFALVTGLTDLDAVKCLSSRITALNGTPFLFEGREIPLHLWAGITTIPDDTLRYSDLFTDMHKTIRESKV